MYDLYRFGRFLPRKGHSCDYLKIYGIKWKQDSGTPTGIDILPGTPSTSPKGEGSVYTLGGQRVDAQPKKKGVYIRGGKKFVR